MACSYSDRAGALAALAGVETLLMVSAAESADRLEQGRTFVSAAADAGVRHVVYISFAGAAADCTFTLGRDHWATEEAIRATGMTFTFLRANFHLDLLPLTVGEDGVIRGPAGEGRVAGVARADVARVAVEVLAGPSAHAGVTYTLTGPEALTFDDVAAILSDETGREVGFHDQTVEEAYESRKRWPAPDWLHDAWVSTYTAIRAGEVAEVTDDVRRVSGVPAMSLRDLLRSWDPGRLR